MLQLEKGLQEARRPRLAFQYGRSEADVRAAQKLRWRVFAEEMGARLDGGAAGIDQDLFDAHCEHLIVRDDASNAVVGTYRILPPRGARSIGRYYSEQEFDLGQLDALRPNLVEVGRSCIRADYRSGSTIFLLWAGLARYMVENRHEHMIGCASLSLRDGGHGAASVYARVKQRHLCPPQFRVYPRSRLPLERLNATAKVELPPLVKGYLNVGAWVCGEPAWDRDFNVADLLILLPLANINARYAQHFLAKAA